MVEGFFQLFFPIISLLLSHPFYGVVGINLWRQLIRFSSFFTR